MVTTHALAGRRRRRGQPWAARFVRLFGDGECEANEIADETPEP